MKKIVLGLAIILVLVLAWYNLKPRSSQEGSEQAEQAGTSTTQTVTTNPVRYTVKAGEGLWQIAQAELGDGERWIEIAKENNLTRKPYTLYVGQELTIPGKTVEVVTEREPRYTLAQVAEHGARDNCWLAIEGKVYDVTPYISSGFHPGKLAIVMGCGKDATELFNTRPMGTGTPHSERARNMLPTYYVGELATE